MDWKKLERENCKKCTKRLDCVLLAKGVCPMSYIRMGHPLMWFKGDSHSYVFVGSDGVVDYDDEYNDTATLIELIGNIIAQEIGDMEYATKIVGVLATRLGVVDQLRHKPLTFKEHLELMVQKAKDLKLKP